MSKRYLTVKIILLLLFSILSLSTRAQERSELTHDLPINPTVIEQFDSSNLAAWKSPNKSTGILKEYALKPFDQTLLIRSNDRIVSDDDTRLMMGINLLTVPFKSKYLFIEGEFKIASKISLTTRISYARLYRNRTDDYKNKILDDSRGAGVGTSVRYYFTGNGNLKGFFTGFGIELMFGNWENFFNGSPTHYDYGQFVSVAPHVDIGYKVLLGKEKRLYIDPMVALGFFSSTLQNERTDSKDASSGFFGFPGLTFGLKLK